MGHFIAWLAASPASAAIQNAAWIVPAVQCLHILAVSVVVSSAVLLNLRLLGVLGAGEAMDIFTRRYLPWAGGALLVLLLSGTILIVAEPNRDLGNPVFWTKMTLLMAAIVLTAVLEKPILHDAAFWQGSPRRPVARILAMLALACWIGIVFCGRWIAYTYAG